MEYASDEERLVAEHAVVNFRELQRVMKSAPYGKGLAVLEHAVREKGFEQMNKTLSLLASAHEEAQKKGPTASRAPADGPPTSRPAPGKRS